MEFVFLSLYEQYKNEVFDVLVLTNDWFEMYWFEMYLTLRFIRLVVRFLHFHRHRHNHHYRHHHHHHHHHRRRRRRRRRHHHIIYCHYYSFTFYVFFFFFFLFSLYWYINRIVQWLYMYVSYIPSRRHSLPPLQVVL